MEDRRWCFILDESVRSQYQVNIRREAPSDPVVPNHTHTTVGKSGGGKMEKALRLTSPPSKIRTLHVVISSQLLIENSRVRSQGSIYWICGHSGNDKIFLLIPVLQFSTVIIIPSCSFKYHSRDGKWGPAPCRCRLTPP